MTEYRFIGGPADGRVIATDGFRRWRVPVLHPVEIVVGRKVIPFRRGPELSFDVAEYERFGPIYWWDGFIGDAQAELDVADEVAAIGGPILRAEVRYMLRRELQGLAPEKELGRIIWRLIPHPATFRTTVRALVGPRAAEFGQVIRSERVAKAAVAALNVRRQG